ncbi:hypothetical protein, partial [Gluconobacter cerinus]|uniref:hypothetical protein n=1 Tax=Gluconobacter cerinus TaxID=38307 RepID=UPI001B8B22FE
MILVISGGNTSPVLKFVEEALDAIGKALWFPESFFYTDGTMMCPDHRAVYHVDGSKNPLVLRVPL